MILGHDQGDRAFYYIAIFFLTKINLKGSIYFNGVLFISAKRKLDKNANAMIQSSILSCRSNQRTKEDFD